MHFSSIFLKMARLSAIMLLLALGSHSSSFCAMAQASSEMNSSATPHSDTALDDKPQSDGRADNAESVNQSSISRQKTGEVDIATLVRESDFNGAAIHERLLDFTYLLKRTRRKLDRHNKIKEEDVEVFEAYPITGKHVLIMLSKNGEAVSEEKMAEVRKRAGEALARAESGGNEQRVAVPAATTTASNDKRHLIIGMMVGTSGRAASVFWDISDFMRLCEFSAPRREMLDNREMIVMDFRPNPAITIPKTKLFISKLVGRVWIDLRDKVVARLEGRLSSREMSEQGKENKENQTSNLTVVSYEQVRLPTGEWFPRYVRMNSGGDPTVFNGVNWDLVFEFSDYKRFNADVGDVMIDSPKKKNP